MPNYPNPVADLAIVHDAEEAADACRILIRAYLRDPEHVDWSDVQGALLHALLAFNLPEDYPKQMAKMLDDMDACGVGVLDERS